MQDLLDKLPKIITDDYERRARLYPGLYAFLPVFISFWAWFPDIDLLKIVVSILVTCGGSSLLARIARNQGYKKQSKLYKDNDGKMPTTTMLRHRDNSIDSTTKERYYKILQTKISNFTTPSKTEEQLDPDKADIQYESAVSWLKEQTRDKKKFPLVREELINYGYERNLWGLKYYGIGISFLMIIINVAVVYYRWGLNINEIPTLFWISIAVCIISITFWIFFVTKSVVISTAHAYARRLLAACEKL